MATEKISKQLRNYKYRLYPNKGQRALLGEMLVDFCELYNAALEHRIGAFQAGEPTTYYNQTKSLPEIRRDLPQHGRWSATAQQQVLRKLDRAYKAFFGRVKRGGKAGFPRFKSRFRYHAADFRVGNGLTIRPSNKIRVIGVEGEIKVKWHRELPSLPKAAILTRQAGKWFIVFAVEVETVERASQASVGIDVGLTTLVADCYGGKITRPNFTKRAAKGLRRRQRALARCKRGSKVRTKRKAALAKFNAGIANRRRDSLHKISRDIVNKYGRIAVENLNIKGLVKGKLAKHVYDAAWNMLISMIRYKAASAGCEFVEVDPSGTSQTCPKCGNIKRKQLKERLHNCDCGCVLDRDVASAMVIHFRAFGFWPGIGRGILNQRVAA